MAGSSTVTQKPLRQKLKVGYSDIAQSQNHDLWNVHNNDGIRSGSFIFRSDLFFFAHIKDFVSSTLRDIEIMEIYTFNVKNEVL